MPLLPRFLSVSLPVIAALLASSANAADKIAMRFEVFGFAGLHVATDRTLIEENGSSYAITGDVKTTGIAGIFQDFQKKSIVRGRLAATGVQPETYSADVRRDKAERHDKIDFRANATASGSSSPAPAKSDATSAAAPPRDAIVR